MEAIAQVLLIRQKDAAKSLNVTDRTLRNWERRGLITARRIGGITGYLPDDLRRLASTATSARMPIGVRRINA